MGLVPRYPLFFPVLIDSLSGYQASFFENRKFAEGMAMTSGMIEAVQQLWGCQFPHEWSRGVARWFR